LNGNAYLCGVDCGEHMNVFTIAGQGYDSNIFVVLGEVPSVVDTGTGLNNMRVLEVFRRFVDPSAIRQVVLTHEHYDHVGGVEKLIKVCGEDVKVFAHKETEKKLREGQSAFAEMLGGSLPRISIDSVIGEGDVVMCGDVKVSIMETPGHSMGGICLYDSSRKVLFSGDTVFAHGDFGRFDLPGGDYMALLKSMERLESLGIDKLYPGHGPIVEGNAGEHLEKALFNVTAYG
jgi:glyoxylase-like metal-dependent hydrolase (beta-lactamase superfamily II)